MTDAGVADRLSELRIDRARRGMRRPRLRRRIVLVALAAAVALAAVAMLASRTPAVEVVQVREARPGEAVTALAASGYVASRRHSIVAPKIAGRLKKVLVQEGERVEEGQIIARLDDDDAWVALQQAEAREQVAGAQAAVAREQAVKGRRELLRARTLARGGAISSQQLQDATTAARTASAQERAAAAEQGAAARAVAAARLNLDHTVIRAPFAGTVARKLADEGAVLAPAALDQPNVGGIVELVDLGQLEVETEVSEDQLARVRLGQPALVVLDAYPDRVFRAVAGTVRPAIDKSKGTAVIKVDLQEQPEEIFPGMAAKVSFLSQPVTLEQLRGEPRLRVPASAVVERGGTKVVLVVSDGRIQEEPVEVGPRYGDEVALVRGPAAGARVVASPGARLRSGSRVKAKAGAP